MKTRRKIVTLLLTMILLLTAGCGLPGSGPGRADGSQEDTLGQESTDTSDGSEADGKTPETGGQIPGANPGGQSFAQAHDTFQTTLAREDSDDYEIPAPPEGLFDLVHYASKVGDLAAYVSSDPGDGQKHPMIIWVVGGWGNGIDDFPWCYPAWDNDQTASAFWQAGVLTMYPSFRGGSGNPGHYETLFGEVDDILSAYEYAASLPYVDPDRIYLGGHSTGGTRALLAAEHTDKFRTVFCFGAVDEIKYHNNSQFTFDTGIEEEFIMRSPIYWLDDVKTPTFLIEGSDGNSANLENIRKTSNNDNIHCYIINGEDHFSVLAPVTRLLAQKILADTGAQPNISLTQEELEAAMHMDPETPQPVMTQYIVENITEGEDLVFSCPYIWDVTDVSQDDGLSLSAYSRYEEDNVWDMTVLYIDAYTVEDGLLKKLAEDLKNDGYEAAETEINGAPAVDAYGRFTNDNGTVFNNRLVIVQCRDVCVMFDLYIHESFGDEADSLIQSIVNSIRFTQ